ncbi:unnamed protein product, partial [Thlaspi arvense]
MVLMMMVMVVMMESIISTERFRALTIDQSSNVPKLFDVARNRDCPFLSEPKLFFSFFQELVKENGPGSWKVVRDGR